ncbi:Outer membrane protein assembly factor BamB [subsurface metagenome]
MPPVIANDGKIYVGSFDQYLYCFNPDGTTNWKVITGGNIFSTPAIDNSGKIYVGTIDSYLYCFNPNGTTNWKCSIWGTTISSPALHNNRVYVGSDDNQLYCFNTNGSTNWMVKTGGGIVSSPAIRDGKIYIGSSDFNFYCFNTNGATNWKILAGNAIVSSPAIGDDNRVYFGSSDSYLYCSDTLGNVIWKSKTGDRIESSPVLGGDGKIYIGSWDDYFYCFNSDGSTNWMVKTGGNIVSSPAIDNNKNIYVGCDDGYLYCFKATNIIPQSASIPIILSIQVISTNQIYLEWSNVSNETSYTLFRSTVNDTNTATNIQGFSFNVTNYSDNTLIANTTYYYWVKAYNVMGPSGFSAVVWVKTLTGSGIKIPKEDVAVYNNYLDLSTGEPARIIFGKSGKVTIRIYTMRGVLVKEYPEETYNKGDKKEWFGDYMDTNNKVAAGIYIVVVTGDIDQKLKMIVK